MDLEPNATIDMEQYQSPEDLLRELEFEGALTETETPSALKTPLLPHQKQALTFMRQREQGWSFHGLFPDLWRFKQSSTHGPVYVNTVTGACQSEQPRDFRGGILADQMGLGKSLSAIALIASDRDDQSDGSSHAPFGKASLLVVRAPLLHTWQHELRSHLHRGSLSWRVHHSTTRVQSPGDLNTVDIVITTYHTLVAEHRRNQARRPSVMYGARWRRVILDEAHDIRDHSRITAKAMCTLDAYSRWALTGTPIQNQLSDVASLYQFLQVVPYHEPRVFKEHVRQICMRRHDPKALDCLKHLLRCITLRRSIATVQLPQRSDLVCKLDFSPEEQMLYDEAKSSTLLLIDRAMNGNQQEAAQRNVLTWINSLRMICNLGVRAKRPTVAVADGPWDRKAAQELYNSLVVSGTAICTICCTDLGAVATEVADQVTGSSPESMEALISACLHLVCGPCRENSGNHQRHCNHTPAHEMVPVSTLSSHLSLEDDEPSHQHAIPTKIKTLMQQIDSHIHEQKCVVFSFWTSTLDIIEQCLKQKNIDYIRFDGKVSHKDRATRLASFQNDSDVRVALFTISCGCVGLNLTAASRVYLMEPHWNPSVEQQALARVYRMGQQRPVTTVRYIMRNTFEEHVVQVQKRKQALSELLLSSEQSGDHESSKDRLLHWRSLIMS